MKRKIIGISIVLLLLAIIPSTSIATVTTTQDDSKLLLKGTIVITEIENNTVHAFAIRLFYYESTDTEHSLGWIWLNDVIFPDGFLMIPLGRRTFATFVIGFVKGHGGIEIE